MTTKLIMNLIFDYADAYHNQMSIAEKIKEALEMEKTQIVKSVFKVTVVDDQHPNGIPLEQK